MKMKIIDIRAVPICDFKFDTDTDTFTPIPIQTSV